MKTLRTSPDAPDFDQVADPDYDEAPQFSYGEGVDPDYDQDFADPDASEGPR